MMNMKLFVRTFPSTEECELFESLLQTKWPDLLADVPSVRFRALKNPQSPHISIVVWEFPDEPTQKRVETLIEENIARFAKTLAPKTMTVSGQVIMDFGEPYLGKA